MATALGHACISLQKGLLPGALASPAFALADRYESTYQSLQGKHVGVTDRQMAKCLFLVEAIKTSLSNKSL